MVEKNRSKEARIPRILGRHRALLKFVSTVLNKNLTASEAFEIVLDNYDAKKVESKS